MRSLVLFVACTVAAATPCQAADPVALNEMRVQIGNILHLKATERVREMATAIYHRTNIDGLGVSKKTYELIASKRAAQSRSQSIAALLLHDLNGDGRVERAEAALSLREQASQPMSNAGVLVVPTPEQVKAVIEKLVSDFMRADTNNDGIVELPEMIASYEARNGAQERSRPVDQAVPLGLDTNGDGIVSLAEYLAAVERVLKEYDTDGDGTISPAEHDAAQISLRAFYQVKSAQIEAIRQDALMAEKAERCPIPAVPAGAHVSFIGVHGGAAVSNVSIGGDSELVDVAQVEIQQGTQPLYVVVTSSAAMIWQVTGAVDRVKGFVAASMTGQTVPLSGVTGLPKSAVTILPTKDCLPFFSNPDEPDGKRAVAAVTVMLGGRAPDLVVGRTQLARIRLPIGTSSEKQPYPNVAPAPANMDASAVYEELLSDSPGGVVLIDPAQVVAADKVKLYGTLPGKAGLIQLIERGVLQISGWSRSVQLGGTRIIGGATIVGGGNDMRVSRVPSGFRIVGPMQFPAGLNGAHSVRFVIAPGVALPTGNPGQSNVVCESTGQVITPGQICR
jgi:EF hand